MTGIAAADPAGPAAGPEPHANTLRLFVAVQLPDVVRAHLADAQRRLAAQQVNFRWVRPEAMHVTLAFLGNTPAEAVPRLERAMRDATRDAAPLRLEARGLDGFPDRRRPRVLWAGLAGDLAQLATLQRRLQERLVALGFTLEERAFRPHVTLGRAPERGAAGARLPVALEPPAPGRSFGAWTAREIELVRSDLSRRGSVYTTLSRAPLGAEDAEDAPAADPRPGGLPAAEARPWPP